MRIKRDYSEPFFGPKRRKSGRLTTLLSLAAIAVLIFIALQREKIPGVVNDMVAQIVEDPPTPTPLPSQLANQAAMTYSLGDFVQAADLYERALLEEPDNIDYLYEYGQTLIELNRPQEALDISDQIIQQVPNDPRGFALKTRSMVWLGQSSAALPVGRAGLDIDPNFAPLYSAMAQAYTNTQRWSDGLQFAERAIELAPNDVNAHRAYAQALNAVGENELAISQLLQAIELQPNYTPPYFELAALYLATNRNLEAIETYDVILSMVPRNPRALLRQCQAYLKVGEFAQAEGYCEDAVAADPTYATAQFQLGRIYYRNLDFESARVAFEICVSVEPGNLECKYRYGLTQYYVGQCSAAWTTLQDSLIMAQSREGTDAAITDIRAGLEAISNDPECSEFNSTQPQLPTATPEAEEGV